jgi:uncharacterized protein YggT (Ycf19 family)
MPSSLFIVSALRAVVEVALLALIGQGALALLAGSRRQKNPVYQLFVLLTQPVLRLMRCLTPRTVIDRHLPLVAFFVLFWLWIFLAWLKRLLAGL